MVIKKIKGQSTNPFDCLELPLLADSCLSMRRISEAQNTRKVSGNSRPTTAVRAPVAPMSGLEGIAD